MEQGEPEEQRQRSVPAHTDWLGLPFIPPFLRFSLFIPQIPHPEDVY